MGALWPVLPDVVKAGSVWAVGVFVILPPGASLNIFFCPRHMEMPWLPDCAKYYKKMWYSLFICSAALYVCRQTGTAREGRYWLNYDRHLFMGCFNHVCLLRQDQLTLIRRVYTRHVLMLALLCTVYGRQTVYCMFPLHLPKGDGGDALLFPATAAAVLRCDCCALEAVCLSHCFARSAADLCRRWRHAVIWLWCVCVFVCRQCAAGWWSTTWRRRRSSRAAPSSPASSRSRSAAAVSRRLFATRFLGDDVILLYMYDVTKTRVESVCSRMEMYQLGLRK